MKGRIVNYKLLPWAQQGNQTGFYPHFKDGAVTSAFHRKWSA
jgi:hypothetical protein